MKQKRVARYFPVVFFSGLAWTTVLFIFFKVDPEIIKNIPPKNSYLPFFLSLFTALALSGALILKNNRRGGFAAVGITIFLYMMVLGIGNLLNLILLIAFLIVLEVAFSNKA